MSSAWNAPTLAIQASSNFDWMCPRALPAISLMKGGDVAGPIEEKGLGKVGDGPTAEVGVVDEAEAMLWSECLL